MTAGVGHDKDILKRVKSLKQAYKDAFKKDKNLDDQNLVASYAPGRAEIIGNHTDYNEGYTLSVNISQSLIVIGRPNSSNKVGIMSLNEGNRVVSFLAASADKMMEQKSKFEEDNAWANYVKGVIWAFSKRNNMRLKGFSAIIESTIPEGGGVSSSAAMELATAHFIFKINNLNIPAEAIVSLCKDAENNYVGAPCGYLDQATVALADNKMLFISYRKVKNSPFSWDAIDVNLQAHGLTFIIGYDLSSKHSIVEGKYAIRQKACRQSIPILEKALSRKLQALRDISLEEFKKLDANIFANTSIPYKWILHVISENQRVLEAKDKIKQTDMQGFGDLLTESGRSAIYDYHLAEDTPELTWLYETILENRKAWGVIGTRNMGGGFNATTLSLVNQIKLSYLKRCYKNSIIKNSDPIINFSRLLQRLQQD